MTAAFIVTISLDTIDPGTLYETAETISDDLESLYDVISVRPWARPVTAPVTPGTIAPFPMP
jgi:hypothetical protein